MSNQQLVNLHIDFAFKQLFGTSGNEDILIAFLNAILQDFLESTIVSLQLEDPHLYCEHEEDKLSILDISATLDTETKVNVEIQLNKWERMSQDSSFRQAYEARERALMDEAAKFAHARNEGKIQMIKGMYELGVPIETIAKASKLSIEEVELILRGNS
ncbi:Rpn family recombination-promoting nuclease/putative transposase [Bacillus cereus]|uniref:Rpn family recombination-promoting nuclease/putative transposase n=1 Tax=Bacillus cereus TaxID=1396 RepID=UPI002EDA0C30